MPVTVSRPVAAFTALVFLDFGHYGDHQSKHQYMNWCRQFMHVKYKPWYPVHAIKIELLLELFDYLLTSLEGLLLKPPLAHCRRNNKSRLASTALQSKLEPQRPLLFSVPQGQPSTSTFINLHTSSKRMSPQSPLILSIKPVYFAAEDKIIITHNSFVFESWLYKRLIVAYLSRNILMAP